MNTRAWASTVPVAGPGSTHLSGRALAQFPFFGKYGGIDLGLYHHNLVNALTLYTPVRAMVNIKCMNDILIRPCTYRIPLTGMLA